MTDDAEAGPDRPDEPSADDSSDGASPSGARAVEDGDGATAAPDGDSPTDSPGLDAELEEPVERVDGNGARSGEGADLERPADDPGDERPADESDLEAGAGDSDDGSTTSPMPDVPDPAPEEDRREIPEDVQKYARFQKMDGAQYERVNEFLRDRTYVTAREWAIARLCSDFRTETGVEMTKIGENLPELVPFMTDTYTPQAVNQARSSFEEKVRKAGATFLYGAMCDFFTAEELDDVMYEATEVAKFLLEVEGVDLTVEEELEAEERISSVMREVREASKDLREHDEDV